LIITQKILGILKKLGSRDPKRGEFRGSQRRSFVNRRGGAEERKLQARRRNRKGSWPFRKKESKRHGSGPAVVKKGEEHDLY